MTVAKLIEYERRLQNIDKRDNVLEKLVYKESFEEKVHRENENFIEWMKKPDENFPNSVYGDSTYTSPYRNKGQRKNSLGNFSSKSKRVSSPTFRNTYSPPRIQSQSRQAKFRMDKDAKEIMRTSMGKFLLSPRLLRHLSPMNDFRHTAHHEYCAEFSSPISLRYAQQNKTKRSKTSLLELSGGHNSNRILSPINSPIFTSHQQFPSLGSSTQLPIPTNTNKELEGTSYSTSLKEEKF